jgi:hypothetical protein
MSNWEHIPNLTKEKLLEELVQIEEFVDYMTS